MRTPGHAQVGLAAATDAVTIRWAYPDDRPALLALAALDSQAAPGGPILVAELGGELWAALPLDGAPALADPFRPTADLVALLASRARQLGRREPRRSARRMRWLAGGLLRSRLSS